MFNLSGLAMRSTWLQVLASANKSPYVPKLCHGAVFQHQTADRPSWRLAEEESWTSSSLKKGSYFSQEMVETKPELKGEWQFD